MAIVESKRRIAASRIAALASDLLDASTLCAIATVDRRGRAHVNTAYFAWNSDFELVWLSEPRAQHSQNVAANGSAAIAVFDSAQSWGSPDRGIQLFGRAGAADAASQERARELYGRRFDRFHESGLDYAIYLFRAERLKLFDERALGAGTFVIARVGAEREPVWEKTLVYKPDS